MCDATGYGLTCVHRGAHQLQIFLKHLPDLRCGRVRGRVNYAHAPPCAASTDASYTVLVPLLAAGGWTCAHRKLGVNRREALWIGTASSGCSFRSSPPWSVSPYS